MILRPISRALFAGLVASALVLGPPPPASPGLVMAQGCIADQEPNDTPEEAPQAVGSVCFEGVLGPGDQDLALWEVAPESAAVPWTFAIDGVPGTLTSLQLFDVTSEAGVEPVIVEQRPILLVESPPESDGRASRSGLLLPPGRYLLGITRSTLLGGAEPPDGSYGYRVEAENPAAFGDREPNDDDATAVAVSDAFSLSGDLEGSRDVYRWSVGPTQEHWTIDLTVGLGTPGSWRLSTSDGAEVAAASGDSSVRGYDLALDPGEYFITASPQASEPKAYQLSARLEAPEWDAEPNDEAAAAVPIADGELISGRLAANGDSDYFALTVPGGERSLRDVRMRWRSESERRLCLLDGSGQDVICRRGQAGVALSDLALPPGRHTFAIRGPADAEDPYVLRVDATSLAAPDFEAEPNDEVALATSLDPELGMRGRGGGEDADVFVLHTEGEPQLWEVTASGPGIRRLALVGASGRGYAQAHIEPGGAKAVLSDLYLVPGDHWLALASGDGEYTLEARPLGPPSPDAEREPNSEPLRSERYRIGSRRTGRLPSDSDRDFFRFTLAAPQRLALRLVPPADGGIGLRLSSGDQPVSDLRGLPPGEPIAWDLDLQPGDYLLELLADQPSAGTYELTSERLDPFLLTADQEPNDGPAAARDVPATLSWDGRSAVSADEDWYRLPALTASAPLRIHLSGEGARARLFAGDERLSLDEDDDGSLVAADVPLDVPLLLAVAAAGDYHVELAGAGLEPEPLAAELPLELAWSFSTAEVAAYWPEAQRLDGVLRLTNRDSVTADVTLDTRTSHFLWQARPAMDLVSVAAGASVEVPVEVLVQADAWADEPVQVAVAARDQAGRVATASATLSASATAAPQGAHRAWPLPEALLGGINAALLGLGAVPGDRLDPTQELELFDGVTPDGAGFSHQVGELPAELSVDLAGDEPVPVAGTIIDPQAGRGNLREMPRDFELLLSLDGSTWTSALKGTLSPLPIDQAFALETPILARQAMLRITSMHVDGTVYLALGEWKVVLEPGVAPTAEPFDLGAAALGGHVVHLRPQASGDALAASISDADLARQFEHVQDGDRRFELVLGFHEGRAARLQRLEWVDPDGSVPAERLERVEVSTSLRGPTGPWTPAGTWQLTRAADGSVGSFPLDATSWVRYVRLSGIAPEEARIIEMPGRLGAIEQPTAPDYRSILGEWGYTSSAGPYEWLTSSPAEGSGAATGPDAADERLLATPLAAGEDRADRVEIDVDEDWYSVAVPDGHDTLELVVRGGPSVRVSLQLFDAAGNQLPLAFRPEPDGSVVYQAAVEPGQAYAVRVHQPPFSAVFAFDTSGSMAHFLDTVVEGIRSFASDVEAGREAVMIVPFEEPPLLPRWEDDAYLLQDAVNRYGFDGSSSGAEAGLIAASELLAEREGARAILVVTDAETSTYRQTAALWEELQRIRPIIFAVHVGGATKPVQSRHLMQDWAASGGGHYTYPTTFGEMDRAFDRMATWLRRPADYQLVYSSLDLGPSSLAVRAPSDTSAVARALASGVGIEIILDTSASMLKRLEGQRRIDIAKASLEALVGEALAEDVPVAVRTFGGTATKGKKARRQRCQTRLSVPLQPLERASMLRHVRDLQAIKGTKTPIAAALAAVADDLAAVTGARTVVLVTDGAETCGGDPAAAIEALRAAGIDVTVNIVGFALEDEALKEQMAGWATLGDGSYFDASGVDDLAQSLARAVQAPFRVYGPDGGVFEGGTIDGEPILIAPGTYRVEVLSDPPVTFDEVVVEAGEEVTLELPAPDA